VSTPDWVWTALEPAVRWRSAGADVVGMRRPMDGTHFPSVPFFCSESDKNLSRRVVRRHRRPKEIEHLSVPLPEVKEVEMT